MTELEHVSRGRLAHRALTVIAAVWMLGCGDQCPEEGTVMGLDHWYPKEPVLAGLVELHWGSIWDAVVTITAENGQVVQVLEPVAYTLDGDIGSVDCAWVALDPGLYEWSVEGGDTSCNTVRRESFLPFSLTVLDPEEFPDYVASESIFPCRSEKPSPTDGVAK